ncbi:acyltransferase family protein [Demetria terragena]|uniref:acyltransferase family protein n=1 Tax=Demetria terragena TaxID=63959 RepID=UPI00036EC323|nr:acyltransferase family protein [Demetria terragena]
MAEGVRLRRATRSLKALVSTDLDSQPRGYRPPLDGFRGLFVVLVLAYHFGATGLAGGWIGLNHFFVFSGFLIATLLIKQVQRSGWIDAWTFYMRRARRLLPPLVVLVGAVLIYLVVASPPDRRQTAGDAGASLTFWLNWRLIARDDQYFDLYQTPSPLRHVWTLAVEEQFYLLIPWLLIGVYLLLRRRWMRVALVAGLALGAAAWSTWLTGPGGATTSRIYYGTDVRMQAILVGVAFAVAMTPGPGGKRLRLSLPATAVVGWVGAVVSIAAFFVLDESSMDLFGNGGVLLFAILAGGMGVSAFDQRDLLLNRIFSWGPIVHLGQISYGLYLYHWPIEWWLPMDGAPTWLAGLAKFAVCWTCAVLSYRFLELPVLQHGMRGLLPVGRGISFIGPGIVAGMTALCLAMVQAMPSAREAVGDGRPLVAGVSYQRPAQDVRIAVVGDSVPTSLQEGFEQSRYPGATVLRHADYGGCNPIPLTLDVGGDAVPEDQGCDEWRQRWPREVRKDRADVLLAPAGLGFTLPIREGGRLVEPRSATAERLIRSALAAQLRQFEQSGATQLQVVNVPCRVLRPAVLGKRTREALGERSYEIDPTWVNSVIADWGARHRAQGVEIIDLNKALCGNGFRGDINGVRMYTDGVHFSEPGAALTWTWLMPTSVRVWEQRGGR